MIPKKFAERVAREVGVGVERGKERDAEEVETTKMAATMGGVDVAEEVEDGGAADREAEVELAVKAQQEVREVVGGEVVEGGEEEAAKGFLHALGQNPKALADRIPRSPCWLTINSGSSRIKVMRKTKDHHSEPLLHCPLLLLRLPGRK